MSDEQDELGKTQQAEPKNSLHFLVKNTPEVSDFITWLGVFLSPSADPR